MSLGITIALGVGFVLAIIAASIAAAWHSRPESIYVGIVESDRAMGADHDNLHVRAYVDETLVHELPGPSKLIGRMFIRETNTSVPLTFVRVPPYVPPKRELSDEWPRRVDVPVLPVIFSFGPLPGIAVHPGQLVDVCIGGR